MSEVSAAFFVPVGVAVDVRSAIIVWRIPPQCHFCIACEWPRRFSGASGIVLGGGVFVLSTIVALSAAALAFFPTPWSSVYDAVARRYLPSSGRNRRIYSRQCGSVDVGPVCASIGGIGPLPAYAGYAAVGIGQVGSQSRRPLQAALEDRVTVPGSSMLSMEMATSMVASMVVSVLPLASLPS